MSFRGGFKNGNSGNNSFNIPVGIAYQDILSQSQLHNSEVPKLALPVNNPTISYRERLVASYCITHLNDLSDSVFNLDNIGEDNKKIKSSNFIEVDNSDDIERYGDRYLKHKKTFNGVESLTDHPFAKDLFPEELYNVIGFNKKKLLNLKRFKNNSAGNNGILSGNGNNADGSDDSNNINADAAGSGQDKLGLSMLEKLKELAEEVGNDVAIGGGVNENDDDNDENKENQRKSVMDEIEEDDDFEENEEDDDDYNAEKYFDDGDDDDGYGDIGDDDNEPIF